MPPISNTIWVIVGILAIIALAIFIAANVSVN